MIFSSTSFLCLFLLMALLGYYVTPKKGKNHVLCILSILFYLLNDYKMTILLIALIVITYLSMKYSNRKQKHLIIIISFLIFILAYYKYYQQILNHFTSVDDIIMPLGISFIIFSMMSCIFDHHRNENLKLDFYTYFNYILYFPKIFMGPLMRYEDFQAQWNERSYHSEFLEEGSFLLLKGCFHKVVLSNTFALLFNQLQNGDSLLNSWLILISYAFQLYFDFYGYTCMASGISKFFMIDLPKNFDHPYVASGIQNFWTKWHISLSTWFKDYVYIPLGGNRVKTSRAIINLIIVWVLTGLWHGSSFVYLLWGLYYACLLLLEKYVFKSMLEKIPTIFKMLITFILVMIGWVFFFYSNVNEAFSFIASLFDFSNASDLLSIGILKQYFIFYFVGFIMATPLMSRLHLDIKKWTNQLYPLVHIVFSFSGWILVFMYLIADSYQAFLYFQF